MRTDCADSRGVYGRLETATRKLIDDNKDVPAVDHIPIAALPVPVTVPVRVPVGAVPVATSVHGGGTRSPNSGPAGVGVICAISRSDG